MSERFDMLRRHWRIGAKVAGLSSIDFFECDTLFTELIERVSDIPALLDAVETLTTRSAAAAAEALPGAARDVLAERARQVIGEGWTPAHDDAHVPELPAPKAGPLARAAACYAVGSTLFDAPREKGPYLGWMVWPWDMEWWKPTPEDRRRDLVKAGALILAEIERLDRAARALEGGAT